MIDYYKILDVLPTSNTEEIKKAYRRHALKYHPDKNLGDKSAETKFKEIAEAYDTLSDIEKRKKYDYTYNRERHTNTSDSSQQKQKAEQKTNEPLSPLIFLSIFRDLRKNVAKIDKKNVNQRNLFDSINDLLTYENINFLVSWGDIKTNNQIIEEVLGCCGPLGYDTHLIQQFVYIEKIVPKLITLAGKDKTKIQKIYNYKRQKKFLKYLDKYKGVALIGGVILLYAIVINSSNEKSTNTPYSTPINGDLNNTIEDTKIEPEITPKEKFLIQKDSLISDGWQELDIDNGQLSTCYNFKPQKGKIDNYLEIIVGGGTDVAVKVMNLKTGQCIRYVFINSGSTYKIKNIPEGQYYLKIAYGKNWLSKVINGQCIGKFIQNPMYEKGEDIFDYNLQYETDGYKIPSFRLSLDVIASDISNSFNFENISENEFNL